VSPSPSHIVTDGQSVCLSWCRIPSGAHDHILVTVWQLLSCPWEGALSDERTTRSDISRQWIYNSAMLQVNPVTAAGTAIPTVINAHSTRLVRSNAMNISPSVTSQLINRNCWHECYKEITKYTRYMFRPYTIITRRLKYYKCCPIT
jgi:hypothetical protein